MAAVPDHTAVRVALWRALHLEDPPPHVFVDELGLRMAAPDEGWRKRPDMDPVGTRGMRAWIVARARFVEDTVEERAAPQYVILGAGLDTYAQRHPELANRDVFEIDQPATQAWKQRRLAELGLPAPAWLHFVPVDFEAGQSWLDQLAAAGFDTKRPAVVASTGVSMYLTHEANADTLRRLATLAPGSTVIMTFMLPMALVSADEQIVRGFAERGAAASGTPFISFYTPDQILALARDAGFSRAEHVSTEMIVARYFAQRTDGLRPAMSEQLLVATV